MTIKLFMNKKNHNKYIEMKRYNDGHYYFRQYIKHNIDNNIITYYVGAKSNRGRFFRQDIKTMKTILVDYVEL